MSELPILNCDGCDACCRNQPSPPGYVVYWSDGSEHLMDPRDFARMRAMPPHLRLDLETYYLDVMNGVDDDTAPCMWLTEDGKCRHYEHRPQICRDFAVGGPDCLGARD